MKQFKFLYRNILKLWRAEMLDQATIDSLTARIKALEPKVAALEAAQQPPVDATALEAEVTKLEAQFPADTAAGNGTATS
jgi:hypothetical protein